MPRRGKQPDPSGINIIVVGYEQEAKCHLLNALCRDEEAFKQFACRTKPSVKNVRRETISGREIILVQTASLNTPAWVRMREDFLTSWKTLTCVFLYVTTNLSSADDAVSIKSLKGIFGEKQVRSVLCYRKHNKKHTHIDGIYETFQHKLQLDTDFATKVCEARKILEKLKAIAVALDVQSVSTDPSEVGSEKTGRMPKNTQGDEAVVKDATELAGTVLVSHTEYTPRMKERLTQEDWQEFRQTLLIGKARSNHVRVNVVGNHGVGKTSLINRLLMKRIRCPEQSPIPTENLEIHRVTTRCVERNGKKQWEKEEQGKTSRYVEELNIQRMAQALMQSKATTLFKDKQYADYLSMESKPFALQSEENNPSRETISKPLFCKTAMSCNTPVYGNTPVPDNTPVSDSASLSCDTPVSWNTPVSGNTPVYEDTPVSANTMVSGDEPVIGYTHVSGNTPVAGDTPVAGNTPVSCNTLMSGDVPVSGDTRVSGNTPGYGNTLVSSNTTVSSKTLLPGDTHVSHNAQMSGNTSVSSDTSVSVSTTMKWKTTEDHTQIGDGKVGIRLHLCTESNLSGQVTSTEQSLYQNSSIDENLGLSSEEVLETDPPNLSLSISSKCSTPISPHSLSVISDKTEYLRKVIYCKDLLEKENNEKIYVSFWDYAGQSTYYATHHLFMSPSAVYLLVMDLRKELNDLVTDNLEFRSGILQSCTVADALKFWVRSIKAYTQDEHGGYAPIIIVGTHRDDIKDSYKVQRKFKDIRKLLATNAECIAIDNTLEPEEGDSYTILKNKVIDVGLGIIDEKVSAQWINLEYDMQESRVCDKGYMKFSDLQKLDMEMDVPVCNGVRLEAFLCHQHYHGHLLYFKHPELKNLIITSPIIMIEFLNLVFRRPDLGSSTLRTGWNEDGVLNQEYIIEIAEKILKIEEFAYMILLKILVQLHILHPVPSQTKDCKEDKYFIPCLLPNKEKADSSDQETCEKSSLFQVKFRPDRIHQTTFHQILCALLKNMTIYESRDKKEIYNLDVTFEIKEKLVLLFLSWENDTVVFFVEDFSDGGTESLNKYVEEARDLIEDAIESVLYANGNEYFDFSFHVECPEHKHTFLSLKLLQENSVIICDGNNKGKHRVRITEINGVVKNEIANQHRDPILQKQPTDTHLGRLALKIKAVDQGETALSLALRLKMQCAFAKADIATRDIVHPGEEFIHLLITWRNSGRKDRTIHHLLTLITKWKDYNFTDLKEAMMTLVKSDPQTDNVPSHVSEQNKDLCIISQHFGRRYTFALIELGISWADIEQGRMDYPRNTKEMIFQLLLRWRRSNPNTSTVKRVLEAAKMVDIPIDGIIKQLCEVSQK